MDRRSFLRSLAALPALFLLKTDPAEAKPKDSGMTWSSWGWAAYGQLNQAVAITDGVYPTPAPQRASPDFTTIAAGYNWALGLLAGTVYHFGQNDFGQRGDGTQGPGTGADSNTDYVPQAIAGLGSVSAIAAGYAHCLALVGTDLYGWGDKIALGVGSGTGQQLTPTLILSNVVQIFAGDAYSFAVRNDGTLWMTGSGHVRGDGSTTDALSWQQVPTVWTGSILSITGGGGGSIAQRNAYLRVTGGRTWVWGHNHFGELGLGDTLARTTPVDTGQNFDQVLGNRDASYWLQAGALFASGANDEGQCGQGAIIPSTYTTRQAVSLGAKTAARISTAPLLDCQAVLVTTTDNELWGWGYNWNDLFAESTHIVFGSSPPVPNAIGALGAWPTPFKVTASGPYSQIVVGTWAVYARQPRRGRAWAMVVGL